MSWYSIIAGMVSIVIGIIALIEKQDIWNIIWSLFFIGMGISIIVYSEKANKIEKIRRKK